MVKALVIVESPAKAKTINKYLGNDFVVRSSFGHIRDLPTSASIFNKNLKRKKTKKIQKDVKSVLINRMGIDPWHNWKANYQILPGKENIVAELKTLAENVDHVYLATDLDREGEAIAWHLREVIGGNIKRFSRIVFNEITKNAIAQAFEKPSELNIRRVHAQQARRFMDRVVGYMISPLLWKKIARGLSAGRVQSVAVRLVIEREHEIKTFIPEEYWQIDSNLITSNGDHLIMRVKYLCDKLFRPANYEQMQTALTMLHKSCYEVLNCEKKSIINRPSPPFITSTLQQAASIHLGFNVKKTMLIAQLLYEAGYISYMRTDSTNLSQDAVMMARNYIKQHFGKQYLPKSPNIYAKKQHSQEAHEAIRPCDIYVIAEHLKDMEYEVKKLYQLIWCQFVACQMVPAEYDRIILTVGATNFKLQAKGRTLRFEGWTKLISMMYKKNEDSPLPSVKIGEQLTLKSLVPSQHFTKPPSRFREASLVKELEKRGIGRPSTYAFVISTIQERGYVRMEHRRFYAEKMGEIVTNRLVQNFGGLIDYNFTANMENSLDQVANNRIDWKTVLDSFFSDFTDQLHQAEKEPTEGGMQPNQVVFTSITCPTCTRQMGIRTATTGVFLGCSGYVLSSSKERCRQTINLIPQNEVFDNFLEDDEAETNALRSRHRCKKCSTAMDSYFIDSQRKLHICGNNPECDGYELEKGAFLIERYDIYCLKCDKCTANMYPKIGPFGKYIACSNKTCKNTRKIFQNGEIAPPRENPVPLPELKCTKSDAYFILRNSEKGIFLAAHNFPKSRETRSPLVEELRTYSDRLPEKLKYLAEAPLTDPEGNKTLVRYSRKNKQQYIASEKNGKKTNWSMFYIDGKWKEIKK
ncbi:type I DNA topoisomerase [Candidatus Pantoea carbekii]|uniref:type I DNA topoisomerase n=1 Tax=Candidatus Pantoea carbekii TaxID=1235990 RepID=UPI0006187905|nr:type I DNA topoisomerase [Candidatus Pantoea carbekii]AKC32070.1 DNA topoisomerase I TopA [Candidatus Pantoea carbekii]